MLLARPANAADPRTFGRGPHRQLGPALAAATQSVGSDLRIFLTTFAAGFVFVSVFFG